MNKILFYINIVIGLAANKSDLFDKEQVSEDEARQYAQEIGAVFKLTSACAGTGIEDMFKSIGCKFLDPNYREEDEKDGAKGDSSAGKSGGVKLDAQKASEPSQKKGCCK